MIPILYDKTETAFTSNGLGRLADAMECTVSETKNGAYELAMTYPVEGTHYADIAEDRIILAAHDDTGDLQPFRIYKITAAMSGKVQIYARHISYDLSRVTVLPFSAATPAAALSGLKTHAVTSCPYTITTNLTGTGDFTLPAPVSVRAVLGGSDVSILDTFGGELEWDRFTVRLKARRGADNGVTIRYGKSLKTLEKTTEGGTYNAIVPYYQNNEGVTVYAEGYVVSIGDYTDAPPVDVSDRFDFVPLASQVAQAGLEWLAEQRPYITPKSINLSFAALWQTEEYRDYAPIQRVVLGDTVTVRYAALGVDDKLRVVKTTYDALRERYTEITLGELTPTVASILHDTEARLRQQIDEAKQIISQIANGTYTGGTFLNGDMIYSPNIYGGATLHIGANPDVEEKYNFNVDADGNLVSYGGIRLKGNDTVIYAPLIYASELTAISEDVNQTGSFNLKGKSSWSDSPFHVFEIDYFFGDGAWVNIFSPASATLRIGYRTGGDHNIVEHYGEAKFATATVTGLENSGYVKQSDISDFVTETKVQQMIDDAIGGDGE